MNHPLEEVKFTLTRSYGKRICAPGWYWDHQTPFHDYDIFYVLSGRGTMTLGDETFELQKQSCVVMRPGDMPKAFQDPKDRLTVLYLHFHLKGPDRLVSRFPFPRFSVVGDAFKAESLLYQIMDLLNFPTPLQELEFDSLMKQFFVHLFRLHLASTEPSGCSAQQLLKVRQIMAYIREDGGIGIDWSKLAQAVNLSPQYMSRLFKSCTGVTLKEYISRTKVERAAELLVQTKMTISEAADRMGYSDVYSFSKRFKQVFNTAPSQYLAGIRPSKPASAPVKRD